MKYTSINIQGNLISEEILQKIEAADVQGQLAKDFGFEPGINLRSEIEYAWSRIKLDWKHFIERSEKLPASDTYGTTLSRRWMTSFFNTLGFELYLQKSSLQGDNERQYSISHTCDQLDGLPVHIAGFYDPSRPEKNTLDIRSSGGTSRFSPHATIQEYLNVTEHLYAMVTNGHLLRLVRDSGRLVKLTYIEFDLKRLLDEDKYSEFTFLYRLLHASRFPKTKQETEESLLEKYYQDSIESGNRIREGLSGAVKLSLIALGNGLLEHPENEELRERISSGRPNPRDFYHQLLRLIYRLLFLMVTEERDLIFADIPDENQEPVLDDMLKGTKRPTKKQKEIYYQFYSLIRLRKLSEKRYLQENQYTDLWQGLMQTFALFESGGTGSKLGILALGSELFSGNAMPDITSSKMNNKVLLQCIRRLNEFEDVKHNLSFINYRALDVEELGSVYEGLLELEPVFEWESGRPKFTFKKGSERSSSGSHYTPEDLVKPLIQHSLEYLIEERTADFYKDKATEAETKKKLLDLKVCDVACGSGHILLSAARRIAIEVARVETGEQQPNPTSFRHALKEVIRNCIYGVDKNPLAVELCKVALWLESHNPGEPLSFLDHRIKCGDAIVGLAHREELQNGIANEAFKTLPGDDKEIAKAFRNQNIKDRKSRLAKEMQLKAEFQKSTENSVHESLEEYRTFNKLPETTPDEIERKAKAYKKFIDGKGFSFLKAMADTQVAQFFIPKTTANKDGLMTDGEFRQILSGYNQGWQNRKVAKAVVVASENRFFHWFLEFPEVFIEGGFDCILGNPPYLGGSKISTNYGTAYINHLFAYYKGAAGQTDLIAYFVRRIYECIIKNRFFSILSTKTIYQGDTRKGGLQQIIENSGKIIFAIRTMKWPGKAAVDVTTISMFKGSWRGKVLLDNNEVVNINSYLENEDELLQPFTLQKNLSQSFKGSEIVGEGFFIKESEASELINKNSKYKEIIFPFIIGDDINSDPNQTPSRLIINFFDWEMETCKTRFPEAYNLILERVKPERSKNNDKRRREIWWRFSRPTSDLYKSIKCNTKTIAIPLTTKFYSFTFLPLDYVFANSLVVISYGKFFQFSLLQNNLHTEWSAKYTSTMGSVTLRYTPTDSFETFPFPTNLPKFIKEALEQVGERYYVHREKLILRIQLGLTKTYNAFHAKEINDTGLTTQLLKDSDKKTIEKQFGKEVWNLWNHLQKTPGTCSIEEAVEGVVKLRQLHVEMDNAVLEAYGWGPGSAQPIDLKHDFYEVDYLPENDRVRYTIHPEARKEILKRLLELNHKIHGEEVAAGLWDKKKPKKYKTKTSKSSKAEEPGEGYGGLFD